MPETELIEEIVRRSGLSKAELSRRSGVSRALLDDYLRGAKTPALRQIRRLASAADLEVAVSIVERPRPGAASSAALLAQVCEMAEHLPHREAGPLAYPPFRTLLRR